MTYIRRNPFPASASDFLLPTGYADPHSNQFDNNPFVLRNNQTHIDTEFNFQKRRVSESKA